MHDLLDPPRTEIPASTSDDPRVGQLLQRQGGGETGCRVILLGFPSDEGVRRNGGRVGAAAAPSSFRERFYRLTPDPRLGSRMRDLLTATLDLGDLRVTGDLESDQERLAEAVAPYLEQGAIVVVIGGGHETAYGHFLAYVRAQRRVAILNWDAHADVRPLASGRGHSGSPFRQALEHPSGLCAGYSVAGLQAASVAATHVRYVEEHGGRGLWAQDLEPSRVAELYDGASDLMVSFDLDAVDQAFAPGVSAPAAGGLQPEIWLLAAEAAGRSVRVSSIDVVELNPSLDRDGQTARLAALTVWSFLRGVAERVGAVTPDGS